MNKRQLDIIEKLSSAYRKFNISELADECKVSERTIRKDLDKINELLEENKIGRLVLKSGKIIKPNEFNSQKCKSKLDNPGARDCPLL